MDNHNLKDAMLGEYYDYSLGDIADKLYMHINTASNLERSAIAKFKAGLEARGITVMDLLG